ncbi:lipoate--protein ligase [Lutispora saccharofermentans]|uniref:lipoate--protein ligase n=1 Tax=Lutispora saccharofermentans TaxID=3024236 RepID=A0ABT1NGQ5_9FIRM|nr:lipoate--protein ligase [Lutispora saccharofermentans]MCQ1530414.1 lipoate--protein ligase [Lutispora saccharofermentans]
MHKKFKIYISESFDPKFNLSVEEWLMACSGTNDMVLFLWQNANTIVIGRNQNPYKECDVKKLKEDDVHLVRRLSGGGAVYHDRGNLNFTFITPDESYDVESNMEIILNGVSRFGVHGCFNGRNDLLVQGRKFSGNAFISDNGMNCHHGTLLVDVDLDKLSKYLTVSPLKLKSKGIDSVSSRVINLKELSPQITVDSLKDALIMSFNEFYKTEAQPIVLNEKAIDVTAYMEKYGSWEWNYTESPDFAITAEDKFNWGIFEINLEVSDGMIKDCQVFTDALVPEAFKSLEKLFQNKEFKSHNMLEAIENCIINEQIKHDLCCLVKDKILTN